MKHHDLYPMKLTSTSHRKVWGGRKLAAFLVDGDDGTDGDIGEIWLVSDNAGGSTIINGAHAGRELGEMAREFGPRLFGTIAGAWNDRSFPLILKLIHSQDSLSIQVHPDDDYARNHENTASGKTEAWYIIDSDSGASVNIGFNRQVTRDVIDQAVRQGSLENFILPVQVSSGDSFLLPAGRIHSLGPGVVLIEIQQNGPITYRLYDYQRIDPATGSMRQLDVVKALDVLDYAKTSNPRTNQVCMDINGNQLTTFVACRYFCGQKLTMNSTFEDNVDDSSCQLITILEGSMALMWAGDPEEQLTVVRGETILLPAECGHYRLQPLSTTATLFRFFIPDLEKLAASFRTRGVPDGEIFSLSGFDSAMMQ